MRLKLSTLSFITALIIFLAILGVFFTSSVEAASQSSILVSEVPENPAPGENTTITLNSYLNNLDSVFISWSVDGKVALAGIGKKSFSITAPNAGSETSVIVSISLPDGSIDTRVVIRPAVMVLLWQGTDSYVPPFYRGKAMPSQGSQIKVVAMPEIKSGSGMVNPTNMVYAWKQDYTNKQDASGYGKNSYTYINDYLETTNNVGVVASTTDQNRSSERNIDIGGTPPKIIFYKDDATLGTIWEHALLDGHQIPGQEIVRAEPYFISPKEIRIPTLVFNWFINDFQIAVPSYKKNIMPLQAQAGTSGTSKLKLQIESTDKIFANTSAEINVNF